MRTTIVLLLSAAASAGCSSEAVPVNGGPAELLAPPKEGAGVQYQMQSTLEPGQEIERCKLVVAPPEGLFVQRDEVRFTAGSHHVLLYKTNYTEVPKTTRRGVPVNATEVHDCADGAGDAWEITGIVAGSQSANGDSLLGELPEGVALKVDPGTVLVMNTHYVNASPTSVTTDARINLYSIPKEEVKAEAGMLFHYNPFIRVPANGSASARMRCPIARDISIVRLQSHMHRHGVGFVAKYVKEGGGPAEEIYANDQWQQVPAKDFSPLLQVKAGEALDFRCDYENTEGRDVVQGRTSNDEMCVLIGPYFPADPRVDRCVDENDVPAETWIGSGAATCAETMGCVEKAFSSDGDISGCIVDSCPAAAEELSEVLRCKMTLGDGACEMACGTGMGECDACMEMACGPTISACQAVSCGM